MESRVEGSVPSRGGGDATPINDLENADGLPRAQEIPQKEVDEDDEADFAAAMAESRGEKAANGTKEPEKAVNAGMKLAPLSSKTENPAVLATHLPVSIPPWSGKPNLAPVPEEENQKAAPTAALGVAQAALPELLGLSKEEVRTFRTHHLKEGPQWWRLERSIYWSQEAVALLRVSAGIPAAAGAFAPPPPALAPADRIMVVIRPTKNRFRIWARFEGDSGEFMADWSAVAVKDCDVFRPGQRIVCTKREGEPWTFKAKAPPQQI